MWLKFGKPIDLDLNRK